MNKKSRIYQALLVALLSSQVMANTHSVPLNQYSSDDGELFQVKLKDGSTLELVDIDGLSYLGDMILGKTNELKQFGLDVANVDGEGTFTGDIDPEAPRELNGVRN